MVRLESAALRAGLAGLATLMTAASVPGTTPARWYADYSRHGKAVEIEPGRSLYVYCMGAGSPTVVLESGLTESAFSWWAVQPRVAKVTRVCAYDRAGLGSSPAGPTPRDLKARTDDLEHLLEKLAGRSPLILVGHSAGGFAARLYATRHPERVAGVLLVDPSVDNRSRPFEAVAPAIGENDQRSIRRVRACADPARTAEIAAVCRRPAPAGLSAPLTARWVSSFDLRYSQAVASEADAFLNSDSAQMAAEQRPLGALPLVILTRSRRSGDLPVEQAEAEWALLNRLHDEMARASTGGVNIVVPDAGHYIQLDQPGTVADMIIGMTKAARHRRPG